MEAFDSWIRVGAFAVGFLGVLVFFHSILRVALLNRRQRDWLATQIGNVVAAGVSMKPDRDECRRSFLNYRSRYEGLARGIAMATLMPINKPQLFPQAKSTD